MAIDQRIRVLGAQNFLGDGNQLVELLPGRGRVPGLPGPVSQAGPGGQGVWVIRAQDALGGRHQLGELVPGPGGVAGLAD